MHPTDPQQPSPSEIEPLPSKNQPAQEEENVLQVPTTEAAKVDHNERPQEPREQYAHFANNWFWNVINWATFFFLCIAVLAALAQSF